MMIGRGDQIEYLDFMPVFDVFKNSQLNDVVITGYTDKSVHQQPEYYFHPMFERIYLLFQGNILEFSEIKYKSRLVLNLVDKIVPAFDIDEDDIFCASSVSTLLGLEYSIGQDQIVEFTGYHDQNGLNTFRAVLLKTQAEHEIFIDPEHIFGLFISTNTNFIRQWQGNEASNLSNYEIINWKRDDKD